MKKKDPLCRSKEFFELSDYKVTIESYVFYENRFSYFKLFEKYSTNQIIAGNFMVDFLKLRGQDIETFLNLNSENFSNLIRLTFEEIEFYETDFKFRKNIEKIYIELKKYFD